MNMQSRFSRHSLRLNLLLTLAFALVLVCLAVAWFAYDKGLHEADELLDGQLVLSARLLEGQINHEEQEHPSVFTRPQSPSTGNVDSAQVVDLDPYGRLPYEQELAFQIWAHDGTLKMRSANAKQMQKEPATGFSNQTFNEQPWRSYSKTSHDKHYLIQVAHPADTRKEIGLEVALRVSLPVLIAFPLLILLMYWAVTYSLRPLHSIAENLSQRTIFELDPVATKNVPREIQPIITAFNLMLDRVRASIQNERQFTSNAAHELRTPLAGIKLHAQLAETTTEHAARQRFLTLVLKGTARAERLVEQMLKLARLEPQHTNPHDRDQSVSIRNLILQAQDLEALELRAKSQTFLVDIPAQIGELAGQEDLLLVALTNLVGNASKYSPENTTITLGAWRDDRSLGLYVQDQGPGIPEHELATITQRFKRGTVLQGEGSGLGLAIVEKIAALHQAQLKLMNLPGAGLRVEIIWPDAAHLKS